MTKSETIASVIPDFRLDGRLAIITGCGNVGNLAFSAAKGVLAQGASVAISDINYEGTKKVADVLEQFVADNGIENATVSAWKIDVSDAKEVYETFEKINEHHKQIADLLVNCAGFCYNIPAVDFPPEKAQKLINCNLMGSLYTAQALAKALIPAKKQGSIIFIGLMSGLIVNEPQPQCVYNMSKAGVNHLAKSLGAEWAKLGIRVNSISPAYIDTPINTELLKDVELKNHWEERTPMGRLAQPDEFIGTILYLAQNKASSYTTGANIVVDGGFTAW